MTEQEFKDLTLKEKLQIVYDELNINDFEEYTHYFQIEQALKILEASITLLIDLIDENEQC